MTVLDLAILMNRLILEGKKEWPVLFTEDGKMSFPINWYKEKSTSDGQKYIELRREY